MKVYSRNGDNGKTFVPGNPKRVGKDSCMLSVIGDLDELQSWIGFLESVLENRFSGLKSQLISIQQSLYNLMSHISTKGSIDFNEKHTKMLEEFINSMEDKLPDLNYFILPGGSKEASVAHITRTICRRVERNTVKFSRENNWLSKNAIAFLNRLSSYLFALALYINKQKGIGERRTKQ